MLDAFEARLADLFADLLAGEASLRPPVRTIPAQPPNADIQPVLRVLSAAAAPLVGDDAPRVRRLPGGLGLRTVLELAGVAAIDLVPATTVARPARLAALDRVLVAMQAEDVRTGAAFADGTDQGFLLRGFRLTEAAIEGETAPMRALFRFEGDFWPVQPDEDGPAIASIPTRLAVLPVRAGEALMARAGGPDLVIPVGLDLRGMTLPGLSGGEAVQVVARLRGATPPGSLIGTAAALPGYVAYDLDPDGTVRLTFRPPATLAAAVVVRVEVALEGAGRPRLALADIGVRVLP